MKILISDFDGTLFINEDDILKNSKKIKEFRGNGNLFIISTARNYEAIEPACRQYNIEADYFFCDIGSVILDKNGNVLYKKYINIDDRNKIEKILYGYEENLIIKRYGTHGKQDRNIENVIEYKIEGDIENLKTLKKEIDKNLKYSRTQITEDNKFIIHTSSKDQVIDIFKNILDVNDNKIITVGDEIDDLDMLKKYNGYRMNKCNEYLLKYNFKCVNSVSELIEILDK